MNSLNTTICLLFTHFTAWTQRCSRSYRRSRSCGTARPPRFQRRARSTRWPGRQRPSRTQRSPWSQCEWHHQCASCLHSPAQLSINHYNINRFFLKINKGVKDSFNLSGFCPAGSWSDWRAGPAALQRCDHGPDVPVRLLHPGQVLSGLPHQQPDAHRAPGSSRGAGITWQTGKKIKPSTLTSVEVFLHLYPETVVTLWFSALPNLTPSLRVKVGNLEPKEPEVLKVTEDWRDRRERRGKEVRAHFHNVFLSLRHSLSSVLQVSFPLITLIICFCAQQHVWFFNYMICLLELKPQAVSHVILFD